MEKKNLVSQLEQLNKNIELISQIIYIYIITYKKNRIQEISATLAFGLIYW